jgi:hypothetical protein
MFCLHPGADVTLVLPISVRWQKWKRDVTIRSFRNVLFQAAAVIAHHFVPDDGIDPLIFLKAMKLL